jgi:hypothetical protein
MDVKIHRILREFQKYILPLHKIQATKVIPKYRYLVTGVLTEN